MVWEGERRGRGREAGREVSRDLASASPPSDPMADPFQVPIINSIRQMHASARTEHERTRVFMCSYSRAGVLIKRKDMRTCAVMRDKTP